MKHFNESELLNRLESIDTALKQIEQLLEKATCQGTGIEHVSSSKEIVPIGKSVGFP